MSSDVNRDFPGGGEVFNQQQGGVPQRKHEVQMHQKYKFTPDELRTLKECNRESFYYRCLPISAFLSASTFVAINRGFLSGSPKYGPAPKMLLAAAVGYIVGKFSYHKSCAEKLMNLPNSHLGEMLRKKAGRMPFEDTSEAAFSSYSYDTPTLASTGKSNLYTGLDVGDTQPISSFDNETSDSSGYDYGKGYESSQLTDDTLPARPSNMTSYDELRQRNRSEYESKVNAQYQQQQQQRNTPPPQQSYPEDSNYSRPKQHINRGPNYTAPSQPSKNIYGDSMETDDQDKGYR